MARSELFWNLIARKYSKQPVADEAAYQLKLKKTQELFTPQSQVLEYGCGTGSTAIVHAPFVHSITAIDYCKRMVEIATQKAEIADVSNIHFQKSTFMEFDGIENSYDLILAMNILHLMKNYGDAIKKSYRLLKPGGYFISSSICLKEMPGIQKHILPIFSFLRLIPYIKIFDGPTLETSIKNAGFKIVESTRPGTEKSVIFIIAQKQ